MTKSIKFKLYHGAALRSVRVKWMLHEVSGDEFDVEYVDMYAGDQYSAKYMSINPNHSVPTLEIIMKNDESMYMVESAAMIAMLADAFPEKKLAPAPAPLSLKRSDYLQVLHFGASIDSMLWQIRIHEHILPIAEKDTRTVLRYKRKFSSEVEPQLRDRLVRTRFICGNEFCAADCIIAHIVLWARAYGLCAGKTFDEYLAIISERPAFGSAFADAHRFVRAVPQDSPVVSMFTG